MSSTAATPGPCLTDVQLAELQRASPGEVPPEVARHLAGCGSCQQRALFGGAGPRGPRKTVAWPSPQRMLLLFAGVVIAVAMLLYSLQRLAATLR